MSGIGKSIRTLGVLACVAFSAARTAPAQPAAEPQLTDEEKLYGLSLIWKEVDYNFAFFDQVPDLDWDSAYRAFIPQILAAEHVFEYYRTLQRFLALLKDGHTNVYFPRDVELGAWVDKPWIVLREVEHRAVVSNVEAALADDLPIGSEILAVDGIPVKEYLERNVFPYVAACSERVLWDRAIRGNLSRRYGLLVGPPGSEVRIAARTPDGEVREVIATRDRLSRESEYVPPLPDRPDLEFRQLEAGIAYVALNSFGDREIVGEFEAILPELRQATGVVLDLRRNGGGSDSNALGILNHLARDTLVGPAWRTRVHNAAFKAWGRNAGEQPWAARYWDYYMGDVWEESAPGRMVPPPGDKVSAPIMVLIGRNTASAAENFLVVLDPLPNVTFVGEPTEGSTGQPLHFDLPGGGSARVVVKRNTYPDGRDYVGVGIQPDVPVDVTLEDIRVGRDAVLERAVRLLSTCVGDGEPTVCQPAIGLRWRPT
ncbi:MAG: peptidase S41 [Gemmatimonadota bacterium]|nr:MAG: peptidase S41 [Gemmatimonadota bacterium]